MENDERPGRHAEIDAILDRKPGVRETRDEANRYTVVGAASRDTYANWLTPIEDHFVCHRNAIPVVEDDSWIVSLTGLAESEGTDTKEAELTMAAIRDEYPTVAIAHTMECAGNGRGQHDPETGSVQWGYEAVGTAIWTGTPLRSILGAHGIGATDEDEGDEGKDRWLTVIGGDSIDEEVFARSIPLSKIMEDSILAYGMNGQALPDEHGYPVRLIVPGWYGVNNVKWVTELQITDRMVTEGSLDRPGTHARWQQVDYRLHPAGDDPTEHETIGETDTWAQLESDTIAHPYTFDPTVMSLIGTPTGTIENGPDEAIEVRGVAWAGGNAIEQVEVSTDGGDSWAEAETFGPDYAGTWRLFSYEWDPDSLGTHATHTLCSRATDDEGRTQPARISAPDEWDSAVETGQFPWNEGGYAANAYLPNAVEVTVETGE